MSKVLLLGYAPPHFNKGLKTEAANYRTWQFFEPLVEAGHEVCLAVDSHGISSQAQDLPPGLKDRIEYKPVPYGDKGWIKKLQKIHDIFGPDCVVAVNFYPCLFATRLDTAKPLWMDIYGDMITIVQAACYRKRSDRGLPTTIYFLGEILQKGDVFSACGVPQQHMLVGELAMAGRLNYRTFGYQYVHTILPGAAPYKGAERSGEQRPFMKKLGIGRDEFVVLWAGGYNAWTDVETLFAGLELAMSRDPSVRFVSLGANTYEAHDNVYQQLLNLIHQSKYQDRYFMLGWRPWEEIQGYYIESDVGLNIDALHYETIYGTRTRLLEMIATGLPVITTLGSELSYRMGNDGVACTFDIGDWRMMGEHILHLCLNKEERKSFSERASRYARDSISFSETTRPLMEWVKSPVLAPDKQENSNHSRHVDFKHQGRTIVRQFLWRQFGFDK